jgi:glycosyltransferase involved in cell wall biosynthesis
MNRQPSIHVTFPVLNEEAQLAASIKRTMDYCRVHGLAIGEVCIADNGSTDRTQQIGEALAAEYPNVEYLNVGKRGFGLALKRAWSSSKADYVGYMDVDLATDLCHLKEVYDLIAGGAGYQLYLGSRLKPGASVKNRTLLRAITSRAFNRLLKSRLGVSFSDAMCGFKFIERRLYETLSAEFEFSDDWFFATQLAVRAEWMGARILDMPVVWTDQPDSKSSARLLNLSRLYLAGIAELKDEMRRLTMERSATHIQGGDRAR